MRDDRGQVLPWIVVMIVVLVSMAGAVIDLGNAWRVHEQLQASADAAAAAGADNLPNQLAAVAAAKDYSSTAGGKNPIKGVGSVTTAAYADCSTDPAHCDGANTVHVTESVPVKTTFLGLLGINSINETAKASACSPCGGAPLDVMIVLDRTGSMTAPAIDTSTTIITTIQGSTWPRSSRTAGPSQGWGKRHLSGAGAFSPSPSHASAAPPVRGIVRGAAGRAAARRQGVR